VRHGPHRSVLQDLDLVLDAGQTLAIVGASGAGKTTLIRLLTGLIPPDRGEVLMDGQPVCPVQPAAWRACIGVVPQDPLLMDDTLAANIALGRPDALRQDIMRAAVAAQLHAAIERMPDGYDTRVGQRGQRLSGGERQRVAIARALLRQPRLLVLDEATSMLDTETERRVLEQVTKACQGRSTLIIAHRLSTVRHADEIVVLAGGRVAERGTHEQLLVRRGLYADMWEAHAMRSTFPARGP
jgi:ATP-binding cassette subfamily B protein